jgi:hydroxymethylpyrimidine pyrophosphatase-like HAD family hydrolase
MSEIAIHEAGSECIAGLTEADFYAPYDWCLNPILSLGELFQRLGEELGRYESLRVDWQREECKINLYLFVCAIACTVDDYLAWRPWDLAPVSNHFPRLRWAVGTAQWLLNLPYVLRSAVRDRSVRQWRRRWDPCVDRACDMLLSGSDADAGRWTDLRRTVTAVANISLPERLLRQRMRLPEGFRCQDLTHHDVFALVRRFVASQQDRTKAVVVIGVRTAGAYFAPLVKASLSTLGWPLVSWFTIRPKTALSRWERQQLRRLERRDACVLLVDDHPNTGFTFRLLLGILRQLGVPSRRVTVLAPRHPALPDWTLPQETEWANGVTLVTLEPREFHKTRLLDPRPMESLLREYYRDWADVHIHEHREVDAINAGLWRHYGDGFQVRLKRVFEVELHGPDRRPVVTRVLAKSVGWGWLGYHAYIMGTRLAGFVPRVIGLRNGLLITEWLRDAHRGGARMADVNRVQVVSSYVAKRVQCLRLAEDPCFDSPGYRWTGWDEIVNILRGAYGPYVGRFKIRALREQLKRYVTPMPIVIDGRMKPDEWVETDTGIYKVDFEQHNFGGAELDIVDPAYDLASASFELAFTEQEEQELLEAYVRKSCDRTIVDRLLLYQLLHGILTMKRAAYAIARERTGEGCEAWNERYLRARNFLVYRMNRFHGGFTARAQRARWSQRLFFLDLDGVFDCEALGFPHTTPSGVAALELLRSHDFSVVLNTGRSVEHVRNYCQSYSLPGGLAEFGSVFVDAARRCEMALIDAPATDQLARCREGIKKVPGVFIDPGYRYSIRVYRYDGQGTAGLSAAEVENLLAQCHAERLTAIRRQADTYIVQKGTGKGPGVLAVRRYLECTAGPVVAIGDSEWDLEALAMADASYAPANCSKRVRELARRANCRVMGEPFQRGLLAAVLDVLGNDLTPGGACLLKPTGPGSSGDLIRALLRVAERPRYRQFLAALNYRGL